MDVGDVHLGSGGHRLLFRSASRDEEHLELYYLSQPEIPSLLSPSPDAALSGSEKCYLLCPINLPRCERGWRRGKNVTNGRTEGRRAVSPRRASDQLRTASTCRPAPATAKARPRSPPPRGSAATMSSTHSLNVNSNLNFGVLLKCPSQVSILRGTNSISQLATLHESGERRCQALSEFPQDDDKSC